MIELEVLAALALGELDDAKTAEVEEHVLACGACATTLERLLVLGGLVRELVGAGKVRFVASPGLLERLERAGLVARTYRVAPGGAVACSAGPADVYHATHLSADLTGVRRVDVIKTFPRGVVRVVDVPFDAEQGVVRMVERGDFLRTLPTAKIVIELVSVGDDGERALGRYVFEHTAT